MYRSQNRVKVFIVLLIDLICIVLSTLVADYIRHKSGLFSEGSLNTAFLIFVFIGTHLATNLFRNQYTHFFVRGYFVEFMVTIIDNALMLSMSIIVMYFLKVSADYSRAVLGLFFLLDTLFMWIVHTVLKKIIPIVYEQAVDRRKLLIIGEKQSVSTMIGDIKNNYELEYEIVGTVLLSNGEEKVHANQDVVCDKYVDGYPVVSDYEGITDYVMKASVDEVFILADENDKKKMMSVINKLGEMGVTIHYQIPLLDLTFSYKSMLSQFGRFYMITYANQVVSFGQLQVKRLMDIIGSLIGCIFLAIIFVVFGPIIKLESKGPIFFKQKRVGTNGRIFKIIKFRTMYIDAEEKKAELFEKNEMQGLMFKIQEDPRITKVGKVMRKFSLDEFPQFINVLKGEMSLVGTRPPTIDEFEKYAAHHKRRLSFRPGITGLWQVSGRNDISDFEEIVKMDVDYIDNWSILLDVKIIFKTVTAIFDGR